ncbi:hypothetical protein LOAG_12567 [Loa loa]|uniref:DUF2849 domain-containing protein n=1 Tax=Loa loa TaxID=7209 RepID=A0A1I7V9N0_LOALO|nr:hypothetical protein LOAG_12567 [Loa loa]EFO15941.2 hypothetical protein LOAG_12567 [Loa loa]
MIAKQYLKPWTEHQRSNTSGTRVECFDPSSTDALYVNVGKLTKLDPDEAVKNLELRIAKTRERAAGNGNATSSGHRHRHRNFETGI